MSISHLYPSTRPSLSINFARSQKLDPRITFTRTTSGTRVGPDGYIEVIPANSPRFDFDPVTGECLGLLIEEQKQNLFFYNTKHDEASYWINSASTEIINTSETLSPDGTNNATKLIGNNGVTSRQSIYQQVSVTSGVTYTYSVFLKQGERRYACIWFDGLNITEGAYYGASTYFDLQTGTIPYGSQSKIVPYGDGWYRVYVTATPSFTGLLSFNLSIGTPNNFLDTGVPDTYKYTGDGVSGFYIWGHQLEEDKDMSSIIYTSNSQATRSSDNVYMEDISDFFNPNEGTAIITYRPRFNGVYNTPFQALFGFRNSTTGRTIGFDGNTNGSQLFFTDYNNILQDDGGRFTWVHSGVQPDTNISDKVLVSYGSTYFRMYSDANPFYSTNTIYGNGKIEDYIPSSVDVSTLGFNTLSFGHDTTGNTPSKFNQILQQFIYYPNDVGAEKARLLSKKP